MKNERTNRIAAQQKERQARIAQADRERNERLAAAERERQERMLRAEQARQEHIQEIQERAEQRQQEMLQRQAERDRQKRERMAASEQARRDRITEAEKRRQERAERTYERLRSRGYTSSDADDLFSSLGSSAFDDLFGRLGGQTSGEKKQPDARRAAKPKAKLSPSEVKRQQLMATLPPEKQKTLRSFDESLVRTVIATVSQARKINPDRTDWDIHMSYRRTIETEKPDPLMVQKTQISGILLEGTRDEAHYAF